MDRVEIIRFKDVLLKGRAALKDPPDAAKLQGVDVVDGALGSFYLEFGRSARSARVRLFLPIRCSFRARSPRRGLR